MSFLKSAADTINRVLSLTRTVLFECQNKHSLNTAYTAISRKAVGKNVHATIPKGNIWYDQYIVPGTVAVKNSFVALLSTRKHTSMASRVILSNFCEEQRTQTHPQYLSGLSRALFPTTFLEIAVYNSELLVMFCLVYDWYLKLQNFGASEDGVSCDPSINRFKTTH